MLLIAQGVDECLVYLMPIFFGHSELIFGKYVLLMCVPTELSLEDCLIKDLASQVNIRILLLIV